MTKEEAINTIKSECYIFNPLSFDRTTMVNTALDMAIQAMEQEPCEDAIILTKEEYGQLLSNEFDNGYAKGYREALKQDSILDKIRAEIQKLRGCSCSCSDGIIDDVEDILDKLIEIEDS